MDLRPLEEKVRRDCGAWFAFARFKHERREIHLDVPGNGLTTVDYLPREWHGFPIVVRPRLGDWYQTYSGVPFFIQDPRASDVKIDDIAHHLSMIPRFGGACRTHYSVALHSLHVAAIVERSLSHLVRDLTPEVTRLDAKCIMQALMHDATEAYVGDVVRPLKRAFIDYATIEKGVWQAICERFGIIEEIAPLVKIADEMALASERKALMTEAPNPWRETIRADDEPVLAGVHAMDAKRMFLDRFDALSQRIVDAESIEVRACR